MAIRLYRGSATIDKIMEFNESQLRVINCKENALVYASAGTGKTSTLAEKIRRSILDWNVNPSNILCLTFTNRGCEEIKKKVSENVDENFFNELTIKTFHSFCFSLLNDYRNLHNFPINYSNIYDESDCQLLCKDILSYRNISLMFKDNYDGLNKLISYMKDIVIKSGDFEGDYLLAIKRAVHEEFSNNRIELNKAFENLIKKSYGVPVTNLTGMISSSVLITLIEDYQKGLEESHALDFNDLVYWANVYILDESFRNMVAQRYGWIYIDESQDTSFCEYSLIKKISSYSKMILSGDFFQTIYEWRGSNPELIINDFKKNYSPEIFFYDTNYRSTKTITMASFSVLKRMFPALVEEVYKKDIESANRDCGEKIGLHSFEMENEEAEYIDFDVRRHPKDDACILVRTNTYAKNISYYLEKIHPNRYFLVQDYQYYRRPEVKEILAFLKLMINPYDTVSLERIAVKYIKGFGETKLLNLISDETINSGVRIADLLDKKTHDYDGDLYGSLIENLNNGNVVVFDTETTGLNIDTDEIIQIACRKIDRFGNELDRYTTLVKASKSVGDSEKVHHISDKDIQEKGMNKKEALQKFLNFTRGAVVVGQNVTFDIAIMNSELERVGLPILDNAFYDTLVIARRHINGVKNYKLETLTNHLKLPTVGYHDAMEDVIATSNLLIHLVDNEIAKTRERRIGIIKRYLNIFQPLTAALDLFKKRLFEKNFEKFVSDVVSLLNMEKVYSGKTEHLFNIHHFIKLSSLMSNNKTTNYNCLRNVINVSSLSTNDFDAIYKEHGLIPVITVHQSKGCEFDTVYMVGVEKDMYPSYYSKNELEEKRVFYVGITRAKKRLMISYRKYKDNGYGKILDVYPSPYLRLFDVCYIDTK